jgi:hypothetical protein
MMQPPQKVSRWSIHAFFEPRDIWIGVYWTRDLSLSPAGTRLRVYICLLPCLPVLLERAPA